MWEIKTSFIMRDLITRCFKKKGQVWLKRLPDKFCRKVHVVDLLKGHRGETGAYFSGGCGAPLLNDVSVYSLFGWLSSNIAIYKSILKESERKHTGWFEDPLQCKICNAIFGQKSPGKPFGLNKWQWNCTGVLPRQGRYQDIRFVCVQFEDVLNPEVVWKNALPR